jgi:hypothetical protein
MRCPHWSRCPRRWRRPGWRRWKSCTVIRGETDQHDINSKVIGWMKPPFMPHSNFT